MTGELTPELKTVGGLFDDSETIYTIPIYQRNFAWEAEQIEQLIADVRDAMNDGSDGYFLGNLIVTERGTDPIDYEVIDGQQRLTTLHLLLTALGTDGAHRDSLRYESRPHGTEALRRIATAAPHESAPSDAPSADARIHEGFNVIGQYLKQHLSDQHERRTLAAFLLDRVTVVRAALPENTDLNRYFEIMNTRGQQLLPVDIVKARLMHRLDTDAKWATFAWIWDACADMDHYVQMSLTRGNTGLRSKLFEDWTWLSPDTFEELAAAHAGREEATTRTTAVEGGLEDALSTYATLGVSEVEDDESNVRFRSTIEFPAFLLHVLKVFGGEVDELEGSLDDKRLIKRFDKVFDDAGSSRVEEFALALLCCRNLFDGFILKRQYTATNSEDGDWSLKRLIRRTSRGGPHPGYINTFSRTGRDAAEEGMADADTRDVLLLQSMLRITYTSPRTMHWITRVLAYLFGRNPGGVTGSELAGLLRRYTRGKVREAFFEAEQPDGFGINRIVFTYLDYLLLGEDPQPEFRFAFRNSIEHFYPQGPDKEQSGVVVSEECLDLLGNLALVTVSANSKFSNSFPKAKAENFRTTIETQSPKLREMSRITREREWGDAEVREHHDRMVALLRQDLGHDPRAEASRTRAAKIDRNDGRFQTKE